jgi:hypothetical protein
MHRPCRREDLQPQMNTDDEAYEKSSAQNQTHYFSSGLKVAFTDWCQ